MIITNKSLQSIANSRVTLTAVFCGFALLYLAMVHFYHQHYLDDAWSVSLAYYYIKMGYEFDYLFIYGQAVPAYFTKTYAWFHGVWAELFGWGKISHQILSVILSWLGIWIWMRVFVQLGASRSMGIAYSIVLLLSTAFITNATRARPDAVVFFLGACALWCAVHRYWFWATLIALISVEAHPIGAINCFYILGVWLSITDITKLKAYKEIFPQVIPAVILGVAYYLMLHYEYLQEVYNTFSANSQTGVIQGSFLSAYFWSFSKYNRFMLEASLIIIAYLVLLYYQHKERTTLGKFLIVSCLMILFTDLLLNRANVHYIMHAYPVFVMAGVYAWTRLKLPLYILTLLMVLYMAPQLGRWMYANSEFYFPRYIDKVREHSKEIDADVFIGTEAQWFAFNHNLESALKFTSEHNPKLIDKIQDKYFVWINDYGRDNFILSNPPISLNYLQNALKVCPMEVLSSFDYGGHRVQFEAYDCRGKILKIGTE